MQTWIAGEPRAPQYVTDFLLRFCGKNPFGDPNKRLVHTATVFRKEGALWTDWPENATLAERGGMLWGPDGDYLPSTVKPIRTVEEFRVEPKYGADVPGWIIESWFPAHMYGTESQWNTHCMEGCNLPTQGPYPDRGAYEAISNPQAEIPSLTEMEQFIQKHEFTVQSSTADSLAVRVAKRVAAFEYAHNLKRERQKEEAIARMRDRMRPIWGASLAAGRLRNDLADKAGIRSHVGN